MNLRAIRTALAGVVVPGFRAYPSYVGATDLDMIVVGQPTAITYVATFGGTSIVTLPVRVVIARVTEQAAQDKLDSAMSTGHPGSIVDALQELTGPWRTLVVDSVGPPASTTVGNAECVEFPINVTINARKDQ